MKPEQPLWKIFQMTSEKLGGKIVIMKLVGENVMGYKKPSCSERMIFAAIKH